MFNVGLQRSYWMMTSEPKMGKFWPLLLSLSILVVIVDKAASERYYFSMNSSYFLRYRLYFRIWLTTRQVVLYIIWFELLKVENICLRIVLGFANRLSANYFDCLSDCRMMRLTEILGSTAVSSYRDRMVSKYVIQSCSNNPLIIDCLTHSSMVENYLYSVIPLQLALFHGKHSMSP